MTRAFFATGSALSERCSEVSRSFRLAFIRLDLNLNDTWMNPSHGIFSITSRRKNQRSGVDTGKLWHHMIPKRHRAEGVRDDD